MQMSAQAGRWILGRHTVSTQSGVHGTVLVVGHVGGLSALFLGASVITIVELVDLAFCRHCACAAHPDKNRKRKSPSGAAACAAVANSATNHVGAFPVGANHRGGRAPASSKSATLPAAILTNSKPSAGNCSTVPRPPKPVCLHQAETDI